MTQKPKKWRDMTPEEKGALLLAHHEGKVIEFLSRKNGCWMPINEPCWVSFSAYRISPDPRCERVTFVLDQDCLLVSTLNRKGTHRITVDKVDGEFNCSSIRMETLE